MGKKNYVLLIVMQLNERGNWYKRFSKKRREFNTSVLLWKDCNLSHQPCSDPPIQEYSPKHRSLKMEIHKIKKFLELTQGLGIPANNSKVKRNNKAKLLD